MIDIKIKLHNERCMPEQHGCWVDLKTSMNYYYEKETSFLINLGVSIEIPKGYEAILQPRSSTFKRYGLIQTNSSGVIDTEYNGDGDVWMMPVLAFQAGGIPEGTRICQFRLQKVQPEINFNVVETLENNDRGGFGSTN